MTLTGWNVFTQKNGNAPFLTGLSSTTKPAAPPDKWLLFETDTGKGYYSSGGAWILATGGGGGGTVTAVTASAPLSSSGGTTPDISLPLPSDATKYLDGTGAFTVPTGSGSGITTLTGDVTAGPGSGSVAATIPNDTVTYAKMQNAAANTFIARAASSSGDLSEVALSTDNLAGRASGDITAITLGSGITMSGGALVASAGASGIVQLARQVLGSDTATVTFNSISGAYNHLKLIITGRDIQSAVIATALMRFNNDSGANYDYNVLFGVSGTPLSSTAAAQTAGNAGILPGATSTRASVQGQMEILIPDYAATVFEKTATSTNTCPGGTSADFYSLIASSAWRNTAAITRIDLLANNKFKTGSIFTLYGIT